MKSRPRERKRRSGGIPAPGEPAAEGVAAPTARGIAPVAPSVRRALYLVFTLSGLTGLVYETTWTRYLQLFLGHAAYAQVLVLSLFMGGMAAGALAASRVTRGRIGPLLAYAAIEALLGVAALVFHPLFDGVTRFAYESLLPGTQGSGTARLVQWLLAALLILPQSVLLGMTFPLMSASVLRQGDEKGGRVFAMLYFTNSAGAVIGVLAAGFWLIEDFGLRATMMAAGAGNLVVAAIAATIARRRPGAARPVTREESARGLGHALRAFAFLTGLASFLYEIAWLRMLALVQGASTHAFETMLSAFILGLALGGLWIRGRIERYASPLAALARIQIMMGLAALATLPAYHLAFDVMGSAMAGLPRDDLGYVGYNVVGYLISAGVMLPAAFFAGMTLPLVTFILYSRGRGESEIGAVYGWNTMGAIAGTALGALVLLPLIGLKNTLVAGAAVDIALGIALATMLLRRRELPSPRLAAAASALGVAAVGAALVFFEFDVMRTASGVFRTGKPRLGSGADVVFHADGRTATVDVLRYRGKSIAIATNGKVDAAITIGEAEGTRGARPGTDEYTMTLAAAVPLAYAPAAARAAVIGHGSGLTTHVLLASPSLVEIDVVEIEPEMIRGARAFLPRVARAYDDPRARYHIEDARAFFARASKQYDIIVSEPSNPWVSGVASLFTPEFYGQAKRALAPNGLFVQWFHTYDMDPPLVGSILRGLGEVFADYAIFAADDYDILVVARQSGELPPLSAAIFGWPAMRAELDYLGIRSLGDLKLFRVAARRAYAPLFVKTRVNSDYFPYLEFGAARALFLGKNYPEFAQMARDPVPLLEMLSGFDATEPARPAADAAHLHPALGRATRIGLYGDVLALPNTEALPSDAAELKADERRNLDIVRHPPVGRTSEAWQTWFTSLFALAKAMIPGGGAPAFDAFLRTPRTVEALATAPPEIRERVAFLQAMAQREYGRVREGGHRLLGGPLQLQDPLFHAYVFVATTTACLAGEPDANCRRIIGLLDQVPPGSPVIDVLRAHQSALR